jgi:hypothetical protein
MLAAVRLLIIIIRGIYLIDALVQAIDSFDRPWVCERQYIWSQPYNISMLSVQVDCCPVMIPLIDVPQPPPITVSGCPMARILVQAFPVFVVQQVRSNDRYGHKWPISDKNRKDVVSEHGA